MTENNPREGAEQAQTFKIGDRVRKRGDKGQWHGRIVGTYSTAITPEGYAVESERETGSVQIYPVGALEPYESTTLSPEPVAVDVEALKREVTRYATYRGYEHNDDSPLTYKLLKIGAEKALEHLYSRNLIPAQAQPVQPDSERAEEWIKAQPDETYDGLKKQFSTLKNVVNSMGRQLSFYRKLSYETGAKHLFDLETSLESERAMNAKLTEELAALSQGDAAAKVLDQSDYRKGIAYRNGYEEGYAEGAKNQRQLSDRHDLDAIAQRLKRVSDGQPKPHARYIVLRAGNDPFIATPCYGMHKPWWVSRNGLTRQESAPVDMLPDDEWMGIDATIDALKKAVV